MRENGKYNQLWEYKSGIISIFHNSSLLIQKLKSNENKDRARTLVKV